MESSSDQRVTNNVMRHEYKVLSDGEKAYMGQIKDIGLQFHELCNRIGQVSDGPLQSGGSRELSIAKTKIEEAVMWAVKHITK